MNRNVTQKTKDEVYERDEGTCVCCPRQYPLQSVPHHVWFSALEQEHSKKRNHTSRLVTICIYCHIEIHHKGDPKNKRQKCKDYLISIYGSDTYEGLPT